MAVLSGALLWALVAVAPPGINPPTTEPEPEPERKGWIQLAPVGVSLPGPGSNPKLRVFDRAVSFGYRWGLAAGMVFEPLDHLMIGATASFDQNIWLFDNDDRSYELCFADGCYGWRERGVGYLVRFGGDLRVGWTSRWFMAWALMSLQISFSHIRLDCDNSVEDHCNRRETDVGPGLGGGAGGAVRLTEDFAVGIEGSVDHSWLDTRDDPFTAVRTWDLALVGVVRF